MFEWLNTEEGRRTRARRYRNMTTRDRLAYFLIATGLALLALLISVILFGRFQ